MCVSPCVCACACAFVGWCAEVRAFVCERVCMYVWECARAFLCLCRWLRVRACFWIPRMFYACIVRVRVCVHASQ